MPFPLLLLNFGNFSNFNQITTRSPEKFLYLQGRVFLTFYMLRLFMNVFLQFASTIALKQASQSYLRVFAR